MMPWQEPTRCQLLSTDHDNFDSLNCQSSIGIVLPAFQWLSKFQSGHGTGTMLPWQVPKCQLWWTNLFSKPKLILFEKNQFLDGPESGFWKYFQYHLEKFLEMQMYRKQTWPISYHYYYGLILFFRFSIPVHRCKDNTKCNCVPMKYVCTFSRDKFRQVAWVSGMSVSIWIITHSST